ncbi:MAG: hypothetical protein HYR51_05485 [Candidatus Rokubacteria bacterium]|nr:hypothetical protein [Candidatus Rokubacteria bacterium]
MLRIMDFEREGVQLVAEGRIAPERGWVFPRWRVLVPLRITPAQSG